jgi:hypothetical protein
MHTMTLFILDEATRREVQRCTGPAADGSCPRVAIGDVLPCAGHALMPAGSGASAQPYAVSGQAMLCPVTLAAALALTSDSVLMLDA